MFQGAEVVGGEEVGTEVSLGEGEVSLARGQSVFSRGAEMFWRGAKVSFQKGAEGAELVGAKVSKHL